MQIDQRQLKQNNRWHHFQPTNLLVVYYTQVTFLTGRCPAQSVMRQSVTAERFSVFPHFASPPLLFLPLSHWSPRRPSLKCSAAVGSSSRLQQLCPGTIERCRTDAQTKKGQKRIITWRIHHLRHHISSSMTVKIQDPTAKKEHNEGSQQVGVKSTQSMNTDTDSTFWLRLLNI